MKKAKPILCILVAALLLAPAASAKTRAQRSSSSHTSSSILNTDNDVNTVGAVSPADLEAKLRPVLEERVNFRRGRNGGGAKKAASTPSAPARNLSVNQRDLFAMMKVWNSLSPEFRALYAEAAAIPKDYDYYVSPGGNFKVFYTTAGYDSVSRVDTVGYGVSGQPNKWRERRSGANGVPDYVDEAAFALDSAWSMEVVRFGFSKPIAAPAPDGSTTHYCVLITKMEDYGVTLPEPKKSSTQPGVASHVEVNGNWSGREWAGLGYNERPYDALRVTCAHEFFHSLQYAMVWTIDLDNLTYGWLEGSAVLMEDLAFPDINDYLQYLSTYFSNPRIPLLSNNDSYLYMNSILLKYLYERAVPNGGIGIVKAVHENNLAQKNITFHRNITKSVSEQTGRGWAAVLNGFHAESYFTGARARPWAFVSDAKLMSAWRAPTGATGADTSANVGTYSVGLFMYKPQPSHSDTLALSISGQNDASTSGATWGASAIVTEATGDSAGIVPIAIDQNGNGRLTLADWKRKSGCLLIATNGGSAAKRITVKIVDPADTLAPIDTTHPKDSTNYAALKIFPTVAKIRESTPIRVCGGDITDVKVITQTGKILAVYNNGKKANPSFVFADDTIKWLPGKRQVPGVYFMSASSTNPATGKKSTQRCKIMLLP